VRRVGQAAGKRCKGVSHETGGAGKSASVLMKNGKKLRENLSAISHPKKTKPVVSYVGGGHKRTQNPVKGELGKGDLTN